jgi:hypothetical protein
MTHLSPRALEALTKGLCKLLFDHGDLDQLSSGKTKAILEKEAAAILTALEAEGMVVVPRIPCMAMIEAGNWLHEHDGRDCWRAMLQAAQGGDDAGQ